MLNLKKIFKGKVFTPINLSNLKGKTQCEMLSQALGLSISKEN